MNRLRASLQVCIVALAAVCGCARDAQAQTAPPPGKALVILYRADKQPVAAKVPVIVNADRVGDLGNGEYINATVNPGRTFLRVGDRILTTLAVQTSAGQTSYVLVEAVPGMTPVRVEMRETNEALARRVLAQGRPAAVGAAATAGALAAAPRAAAPAPAAPAPRAPAAAPPPPKPAPAQPAPPPQRQAQAAPPPPKPKPAPPPPPREHAREPSGEGPDSRWAIIAKTGAFKLSTPNQSVGGLPSTFDKSSKPVAAVELEYRDRAGYALGGEALYYKNNFTANGAPLNGDQTVLAGTLTAKYYIEAASWLYPFVGVGLGYAGASYSGDFTGKASSWAFQGMAGADIRFTDTVGLYLEYKYLSAPVRDSNKQEIKAGGSGILVGLSFQF
jgi:opacity protein-like surface antigen